MAGGNGAARSEPKFWMEWEKFVPGFYIGYEVIIYGSVCVVVFCIRIVFPSKNRSPL